MKNFLIACGGTGGHLFPGIAVAEELRARGDHVSLVVSEKRIDAVALEGTDWPKVVLRGVEGLQSRSPIAVTRFLLGLARSVCTSLTLIRKEKPDAVLGMGGFTSFGPVVAARLLGIPACVHESNAIPGKANRLTAPFANRVFIGFAACARFFGAAKCDVVGTPVRSCFRNLPDRAAARAALGLPADRPVILVTGGSQGASGLNRLVLSTLGADFNHVSVIHLTGPTNEAAATEHYAKTGIPTFVAAFSSRMPEMLAAADVAISRSGASSLAELAATLTPAVLVPFPKAAEDHQTKNAHLYAASGAAFLLPEAEAGADRLSGMLRKFLTPDENRLARAALAELESRHAHESIADRLEQIVGGVKPPVPAAQA